MQGNAIVNFFKLAATLLLVGLVWFTWFTVNKQHDTAIKSKKKVDALQNEMQVLRSQSRKQTDTVSELSGRIDSLIEAIAKGGGQGNVNVEGLVGGEGQPVRRRRRDPGAGEAPRYLSEAAQALWGRHDNFLEMDPEPILPIADEVEGVDYAGRLHVYYGGQPSKINPITASDANVSNRFHQYCMAPVADSHAKDASKYEGVLAVRVEVNKPEYTEYVVFLRDDVYWHTPQVDLDLYPHLSERRRVTAHDFKFTYDVILNEDVNCEHLRGYYSEFESCEVVDDFCFIVRWKKPQYNSISFTLQRFPIPKHVLAYNEQGEAYAEEDLGVNFNDHWFYKESNYVGCGPYLVADLDTSSHLLFRRNEDWPLDLPAIKEIHFKINSDSRTGEKLLESGEMDLSTVAPKEWHKRTVREKDKSSVFTDGTLSEHFVQSTSFSFIGWKNTHPIFKDKRVRKALTLACDRYRLVETLMAGKGQVVAGTQPVDSPFTPTHIKPLPFDLEAAQALLAEAGWKDADGDGVLEKELDGVVTPFQFRATVPAGVDTWKTFFEIFREDLTKIGIKMDPEFLQWKMFVEKLDTREFECVTLAWASNGWESDLHQIWHSSQADKTPSSNFIEYRNPAGDDALIVKSFAPPSTTRKESAQNAARFAGVASTRSNPTPSSPPRSSPVMWWKNRVDGVCPRPAAISSAALACATPPST